MALTKALGGGGGGSGTLTTVKDEGSTLSTAVTSIDFVGAGVTATGTTAVTVTIPSGSGAEVLITETVLGASAATISFSSIAATWRDLRLVLRGRGTTAVNNYCRPRLQMNGDTGSSYDWLRWNVHSSGSERENNTGQTFIDIGILPSSTGPANFQGMTEVRIGNYRGTTFYKPVLYSVIGTAVGEEYGMQGGGWWKSTSAITSLTLILDNGSYDAGAVASLYGIL